MNLEQAVQYLDSFINYEKETDQAYPEAFKLDRMRAFLKELGNPQNAFDSIIVAGSKGKGSTCQFLSSILRMENLKVGLYTSPHLVDVRERIQVNGLLINEIRFVDQLTKFKKALEEYSWRKNPPTYFEMLTALAFCHFKEMKVQVAVLEVGLGGLYDSTNVAPAKVAGLTAISLEHTDKLGKTVSKIAVQKCGIIKGREIVVSSSQAPEVVHVIEDACENREAELVRIGKDIRIQERNFGENFQRFDVRTPWGSFYDLEINLRGSHQMENAAVAVGLAKALERKARIQISEEAIRQGLMDARWPGRLERVMDRPRIILDGAHNVDSIQKMLQAVKRHFHYSDLIVVFACSDDKDAQGMLKELESELNYLILTQFSQARALPAKKMEVPEDSGKEVFVEPVIKNAIMKAKSIAEPDDLIVITGSLYLVAEARQLLLGGI